MSQLWRKNKSGRGQNNGWKYQLSSAARKKKSKKRLVKRIFFVAVLAALLITVGLGWLFDYYTDPYNVPEGETGNGTDNPQEKRKVRNLLFLGIDSRLENQGGFRPDTIMVASINLDSGKVNLVSIPRDTFVDIYGMESHIFNGKDKINHAYNRGYMGYTSVNGEDRHEKGMLTQVKTVSKFLGDIPIDFYVTVDMKGVVEVVNKLDGVEYEVEVPVYHEFGRGEERESRKVLDAGKQWLDGHDVLNYVRYRGHGGDIGRAERQQRMVKAIFGRFVDTISVNSVLDVYKSVSSNVDTNMGNNDIMHYAGFAYNNIDFSMIDTYVFSKGESGRKGEQGIYYFFVDEEHRVEIIEEVFNRQVEKRSYKKPPVYVPPQEDDDNNDNDNNDNDNDDNKEEESKDEDEKESNGENSSNVREEAAGNGMDKESEKTVSRAVYREE